MSVTILEHGATTDGMGMPKCPECKHVSLHADGQPAFSIDRSGDGYVIFRCGICMCVWVRGDADKAKEEMRARNKQNVFGSDCGDSAGKRIWPGDWEEFERWWGEDV